MKLNNLFVLSIIALVFISSCAQNQGTNQDSEFKKMCQDTGYEWMLMKPTKDGKIIKAAESCWGCMVEGIEHVCDMDKFNEMTGMMKNSMMENMEHKIDSMQHMAMTAHAGTRSSVDVHMYKVGFIKPDVQPGKEAVLKFTINELQSKKPVLDLDIVHDKIMHVVLVRNDLKHFEHIHPEASGAGVFSAPFNFTASGAYRIWIDFTINGMQHIVDFDINIPGNAEAEEKYTLGGLKVNFISSKEIAAEKEAELKFEIFDSNNKPVPITEKFLVANAHLMAIDEALEGFNHNHDENFDKDNKIAFKHKFTKPGKYKLWVQFSAERKVRTASFDVVVE
ncbi:hypothetical protein HY637_03160 [Candidatus Woesearchaeota archaeon]|nr:hypothetical protein [Candidatus Woesearchaeota archaeon]